MALQGRSTLHAMSQESQSPWHDQALFIEAVSQLRAPVLWECTKGLQGNSMQLAVLEPTLGLHLHARGPGKAGHVDIEVMMRHGIIALHALCRLNVTFTYSMPAVGDERGKKMNATQVAVLKVKLLRNIRRSLCADHACT